MSREKFVGKVPVLNISEDLETLTEFIQDSLGLLMIVDGSLASLKKNPADQEAVDNIFKSFHTIKGLAGFFNLKDIEYLGAEIEELIDLIRKDFLTFDIKYSFMVFQAAEGIRKLLGLLGEQIANGGQLRGQYYDIGPLVETIHMLIAQSQISDAAVKAPDEMTQENAGDFVGISLQELQEKYKTLIERYNKLISRQTSEVSSSPDLEMSQRK